MRLYLSVVILFFTTISCKKSDDVVLESQKEPEPGTVVSSDSIGHQSVTTLKLLAGFTGLSKFSELMKYDVKSYYFTYTTLYNDSLIEASGKLCIPQSSSNVSFPIMVANHGTIFNNNDAPSQTTLSEYEMIASGGFITVAPDYIGFGSTIHLSHPYYHYQNISIPVIDMLKAAQEYLSNESIVEVKNKVFMFGYSEGGYVSMATLKQADENYQGDVRFTAVGVGAGGYNVSDIMDTLLNQKSYGSPNYLGNFVQSYKETNNWQESYSYFFKDKYASKMPGLYDGTNSANEINNELTNDIDSLLDSDFKQSLLNDDDNIFRIELIKNSVHHWSTDTPLRMYHGTSDGIVPYFDSEKTYNLFLDNGAPNVAFISIEGGNHSTSLIPMLESVLPWFEAFNVDF